MSADNDLMQKIVSLCKRRGFVFQSSDIYGGLRSAYDYGPLGVELKRNLMNAWWRDMVHKREDVVGLDASIIMHPKVWEASGHLSGFSDPLVDCRICKERFRADQAPEAQEGNELTLTFADKGRAKVALEALTEQFGVASAERRGKDITGAVAGDRGYVCPNCSSPFLSEERQFNLMFRSSLGAVDPLGALANAIEQGAFDGLDGSELRSKLDRIAKEGAVYLRPETAQAMFVQFRNIQQATSAFTSIKSCLEQRH
jgi:glycyl-tRNA synthetase